MASGFFALFDDIAVLMDDVATMGKIATEKTAGILGDDLAVNAQKASGFVSSRELPVIWAITKGSFINKLIILPVAFLLSAFAPWFIVPILLIGGAYLGYEGAEKIYEYFFPHKHQDAQKAAKNMSETEAAEYEKKKIKSAIVTDFILSAEIVFLALGTVVHSDLIVQIIVVTFIAILATVGVYGLVALIVRMDDLGYSIMERNNNPSEVMHKIGKTLVASLPKNIRGRTIIGTIAMLLVAGGIYVHNIHFIHELLAALPSLLGEMLTGIALGFVVLGTVGLFKSLKRYSNVEDKHAQ